MFLVEFQKIICDLESDLIWPCLHAALVSLSIYPSSRSSGNVIAMFARALNEFVELLKNQIIQISYYKAYYTNPFAATDSIMIAKMYLVLVEGAKINTISIS